MKNYVQPGDTVTVTAPYAVASGAGCLVGTCFGVAVNAAAIGATDLELMTTGVFDMDKSTAVGSAVTMGGAVYWDDTNKVVTGVATANTKVGVALVAGADAATSARVRLNGSF